MVFYIPCIILMPHNKRYLKALVKKLVFILLKILEIQNGQWLVTIDMKIDLNFILMAHLE